jgi:hypothetical protein
MRVPDLPSLVPPGRKFRPERAALHPDNVEEMISG